MFFTHFLIERKSVGIRKHQIKEHKRYPDILHKRQGTLSRLCIEYPYTFNILKYMPDNTDHKYVIINDKYVAYNIIVLSEFIVLILINDLQHYISDHWIELSTPAVQDLASDHFLRNGLTVASVAGHGVVCISNRYYPCNFRYVITAETIGISCTVISFMMILGPVCYP